MLICFAKEPVAGKVKTRLSPSFSPQKACELYKQFLTTLSKRLSNFHLCPISIYSPDEEKQYLHSIFPDSFFAHSLQEGKSLAERMSNAFQKACATHEKVIMIGSDSPHLKLSEIEKAYTLLEKYDCVLGPANDGGFWLIGLSKYSSEIFSHLELSTQNALHSVEKKLADLQFKTAYVEPCSDIDTKEDLDKLLDSLKNTKNKDLQELHQQILCLV